MTYPLSEIEGLTAYSASKLKSLGIRTTEALLEAARTVKGRKALAAKTGISEQQLLEWANFSDYMRIPGMGKAKVGLVRAAIGAGGFGANVDDIRAIGDQAPGLRQSLPGRQEFAAVRKGVRCHVQDTHHGRYRPRHQRVEHRMKPRRGQGSLFRTGLDHTGRFARSPHGCQDRV